LESELALPPGDDTSFDSYWTESGDGPDVTELTAELAKGAGQPLYRDINPTLTVPGPPPADCTPPETPESSFACSPPPWEQYQSCLCQLSKLQLELYCLSISSPQRSSQNRPSDHSLSSGNTASISIG